MAFKTNVSLATEYERLKALARHLRTQCVRHKGTVHLPVIVSDLLPLLIETSSRFASLPSGMADFARTQESDVTYDVAAEFLAMKAAVDDLKATLISGIPQDGSGYILDRQIDVDGVVTNRALTAQQITALGTKLDAVIATIEG